MGPLYGLGEYYLCLSFVESSADVRFQSQILLVVVLIN